MSDFKIVQIDGAEYKFDDLSDAAREQVRNIGFCDRQIQQLQSEWAVADTARMGYSRALKGEIKKIEA